MMRPRLAPPVPTLHRRATDGRGKEAVSGSNRARPSPRYIHVPNCACSARIGKLGRCRRRSKGVRDKFATIISQKRLCRRQNGMNTLHGLGLTMASSILIGRWTPKVLFSLDERPYPYGRLRRRLGGVSQRMPTKTLRSLESTGLIERRVTGSKRIAVEYSLTRLGRTIIVPLGGMCHWAKRHRRNVTAEVALSNT